MSWNFPCLALDPVQKRRISCTRKVEKLNIEIFNLHHDGTMATATKIVWQADEKRGQDKKKIEVDFWIF